MLAGLHNNLRAQTQIRLDEGFLGYETNPDPESINFVGVGKDGRDANIKPNCATNRTEAGDFNTKVARNLAITPEQRPWLFVVKKQKTVLTRLLSWIRTHVANSQHADTGARIVTHLPLLIIDDEADHASVDTGEQVFDGEGKPDENHQPTAINRLVRRILNSFTRSAYVGYTATPFANIFIHERATTREEGPDLFPSSFIINLATPSDYIGPVRVFGLPSADGRKGGLPLTRMINDEVSDVHGWMPKKHKNGHSPRTDGASVLPPSLIESIDAFILSCAAQSIRGRNNEHSSMLIHVTRFNSVQREVYNQVEEYIRQTRQRILRAINHEETFIRLQTLGEDDFQMTSRLIQTENPEMAFSESSWNEIRAALPDAISDIEVRMINGTAKDALDYSKYQQTGLKVIAIGGDKLARGLTLEGLCVSYFLRASKMYDTLMQMGRWFGYRPGYLDLCRLYTTTELAEWFGHITDAAEELREEFDLMAAAGATPKEYGLKVQSHPVLMVTSQLKMRTAKNLYLSFSGKVVETINFFRDSARLTKNRQATIHFIESMGEPAAIPSQKRNERIDNWNGFLWEKVSAEKVITFLTNYTTHPSAKKVNSSILAEFIQSMSGIGELTDWTVALLSIGGGDAHQLTPKISVYMHKRKEDNPAPGSYSIGRLLDPKDEAIDLDEAKWKAALEATRAAQKPDPARPESYNAPEVPNGPNIRKIRGLGASGLPGHPERSLLLIYILNNQFDKDKPPIAEEPVVAFGISFPDSNTGIKVEYKVNNIQWEAEYGPSE